MSTDLVRLKTAIDHLSPGEVNELYRYIVQQRQPSFWLVPGQKLKQIRVIMCPVYEATAQLTEDEIKAIIDETLSE